MYWLVLVLSISGMPDITMENQMGGYFTCQIAKQKFEDANPPNIIINGKEKQSSFTSTSAMHGKFRSSAETRAEFLSIISRRTD